MAISMTWIYFIFLCFKLFFVDTVDAIREYSITNENLTWWEASRRCSSFGGTMFIPNSVHVENYQDWLPDGSYWIGAVKYPKWVWTDDGSSMYSYLGVKQPPADGHFIDGNSVLACHQFCEVDHTVFGLQNNTCFCLGRDYQPYKDLNPGDKEIPCQGNIEELCGTQSCMSVYHLDNILFLPKTLSNCASFGFTHFPPYPFETYSLRKNGHLIYPYLQPEGNCHADKKRAACLSQDDQCYNKDGDICLTRKTTFKVANEMCSLWHIKQQNAKNVIEELFQNLPYNFIHMNDTVWIGLERRSENKWIDGKEVKLHTINKSGNNLPLCLLLYKHKFVWVNCTEPKIPSICIMDNTTMPERMTRKYDETTRSTSPAPIVTSQFYMHGGKKGNLKTQKKMPELTVIYVGVAVAVAVIVALVTFLVISVRQRRFCFKPRLPLKNKRDELSASRNTSHTDLGETTKIGDAHHYEDISTDRVSNQYQNIACSNSEAVEVAKSGNGNQRPFNVFKTFSESIRKHKKSEQSKDNRKNDVYKHAGHTEVKVGGADYFTLQDPITTGVRDGDYITFEDPSLEAEAVTYNTVTATDNQSPNNTSKAPNTIYCLGKTWDPKPNNFDFAGSPGCTKIKEMSLSEQVSDSMDADYNVLGQHKPFQNKQQSSLNPYNRTVSDDEYDTTGTRSFTMMEDTYDHTHGVEIGLSQIEDGDYSEVKDEENPCESHHYINDTAIRETAKDYTDGCTDGCATNNCTQQERTSMYEDIVMGGEIMVVTKKRPERNN